MGLHIGLNNNPLYKKALTESLKKERTPQQKVWIPLKKGLTKKDRNPLKSP